MGWARCDRKYKYNTKYEIQDTRCMYKLAKGANIGQSSHTSFHRRGHNGLGPL